MKDLELIFTRDAPVIAVDLICKGYEQFDVVFGVSFAENIFVFRNRSTEIWRDMDYLNNVLPQKVMRSVRDRNIDLDNVFDEHEDLLQSLEQIYERKNVNAYDQIRDLTNYGSRAFFGMLLSLWIPNWTQKDDTLFSPKLVERAKGVRERDSLFDDCVSTYYDIFTSIAAEKKELATSLKYLTYDEFIVFLEEQSLPHDVCQRSSETLYYVRSKLYTEKRARSELKRIGYQIKEVSVENDKPIVGQVAYKGNAKGIARVVFSRDEVGKFNEGEILIAPMTTPWYLPLMKKASAFITDEGGIMCHAAIVAREMKKPCITGTKFATKVLKDGDLVEVNADKGTVKILEKADE